MVQINLTKRTIIIITCLLLMSLLKGLDASSYRSAVAGGQEVNDGEEEASEPARDPFEGTEGLFITCHHCRENVEVMGSKVRWSGSHTRIS